MCCNDPPPPPDLGPMAEASTEVARIAQETQREQLAWAREQDTMNRATLQTVLDVQLPAMQDQFENAREDRERWENVFRPLEDEFIAEAQAYDTPERREQYRAQAMADQTQAFDASRQNALQRLEGYGIDPSESRSQALDIGVRTAQAASTAGAASRSDRQTEDRGRQLRGQAIQLGRGLPGQVGAGYAGAVGAGSQAVGGANQTTGTSSAALSAPGAWGNQALAGYGQSADIRNMGYGNDMQQYNANVAQTTGMLQGIGGIAGMIPGIKDGGYISEDMAINPNGGYDMEGEFTDVGDVDTGRGDGSGRDDNVPALLSDGEYVIPSDVVRAKGEEFFDRLLEQYHEGPAPDSLKQDRKAA